MVLNAEIIRLKLFRMRMTVGELAALAGLSRATVSSICNGKSCSEETAQKIARSLDVPLKELMDREVR